MKIALYIEDGREQIVLTPETDTERKLLAKLHDGSRVSSIYQGGFYACQGGWTRHQERSDSSIIVLDRSATATLEQLISEESIARIADDIACAVGDCHEEITKTRHSAMVRLGERLRNPLPIDLERAAKAGDAQ